VKVIGPKKILVIKLQALGDILMTTPAIRLLKQNHPEVLIDHLVFEPYINVTQNNVYINQVIPVNRKKFKLKRFLYLLRLLMRIRKARYDAIINFHPSKAIRSACRLLGSKKIINTNPNLKKYRKYHAETFQDIIIQNFEGIQNGLDNQKMDFFIDTKNLDQNKLSRYRNYMCIHPGGGNNLGESTRIKHWPVENFVDLIKRIHGISPLSILLTGNSKDCEIVDAIERGSAGVDNLCGKINLDELAFLFSKSRVNVSGDTGTMHLAATTETPLVALFGPTDPVQLLPRRTSVTLIKTSLNCAPCYFGVFEGCKTGLENCMKDIPVEKVFECVKKYL
jgi:ADP-heptose:LPS heptosyltransferase